MRGRNFLQGLSDRFRVWARGWLILALVAALALFAAATLPGAKKASGGQALDAEFFYTPEMAFSTIESYGEDGRNRIRAYYLTADVVNPLFYSMILALGISWLLQRGFQPESRLQILNVMPVGAAIFDVLENVALVTMISVHPERPESVAWAATGCTMIKSIFLQGSILVLLLALPKAAMGRFILKA